NSNHTASLSHDIALQDKVNTTTLPSSTLTSKSQLISYLSSMIVSISPTIAPHIISSVNIMSKITTNIYHGSTLNFVLFEKLSSERGLIFEEIGQLLICLTIKEQTPFSNVFQAFDFIRSHVLSEKLSTYKTVLIAAYQQSVFKRGRPSSRSAFSTRRLCCDVWAMVYPLLLSSVFHLC
uniref:Uncharacterized protein n=1 Tax=Glossina palpalis gambiensis TaxID=67801 RepID=A0A1B0C294_9MUSC